MPNSDDKRHIAETFLLGLRTRDWALLRKIMTPDIVWTLPGHSRISGEARGIDAVIPESGVKIAFLNLDGFQSVNLAQDVISQIL